MADGRLPLQFEAARALFGTPVLGEELFDPVPLRAGDARLDQAEAFALLPTESACLGR